MELIKAITKQIILNNDIIIPDAINKYENIVALFNDILFDGNGRFGLFILSISMSCISFKAFPKPQTKNTIKEASNI